MEHKKVNEPRNEIFAKNQIKIIFGHQYLVMSSTICLALCNGGWNAFRVLVSCFVFQILLVKVT